MASLTQRLLAVIVRLLPAERRALGRGLLAELPAVPPGRERFAWIAGAMWFVVRENARRRLGYLTALVAAAAVLAGVDRAGTSDDAGQVSMLVLLTAAAGLGFAAPRLAWLSGLVVGATLAAADTAYVALGVAALPGGYAGAALMLVLIVPAMAATYLGAGAAWLLRSPRRTQR